MGWAKEVFVSGVFLYQDCQLTAHASPLCCMLVEAGTAGFMYENSPYKNLFAEPKPIFIYLHIN